MTLTLRGLELCAVLVASALFAPARPEVADLNPEQLTKTATHVVVGDVKQIWTREESDVMWKKKHHVAEIAVERVDKGDDLKPGALVYARYWTQSWQGPGAPPPGTNGHRGLPKSGERVRVYLARNAHDGFGEIKDGGFNVIGPNGFARP